MHIKRAKIFSSWLLGLCVWCAALCTTSALADPVWHCSRSGVQLADASNNFQLASLDMEFEVMRISLRDLYSIYQGATVKVSGMVVSACFVGDNEALSQMAMRFIGAQPSTLDRLSSKTALVPSHVYMVQSEQEMMACITQHKPAIGYLPEATHTQAVGPCF
jgi:hypothetical protein